MRTLDIAILKLRRCLYEPVFWFLLAFNLTVIILAGFLPYFTFDPETEIKFQIDISISSTLLICLTMGCYFSTVGISEEMENLTAITILSKPISKFSYIFGNYLGVSVLIAIFYGICGTLTDFIVYYSSFGSVFEDFGVFDHLYGYISGIFISFPLNLVLSYFVLSMASCLIIVAISAAMSPYLPFLLNLSFVLLAFCGGNLLPSMEFFSRFPYSAGLFFVPRMDLFAYSDALVLGYQPDLELMGLALVYALSYSGLWILAGSQFLEGREFV